MIYCVVPRELAGKLHEPLRRHFREDPNVEVIVERRGADRRRRRDRRAQESGSEPSGLPAAGDRRRIRNAAGRRVAEQRAPLMQLSGIQAPALPRRARAFRDELTFVERLEPSTEAVEDADTARLVTRFQAGEREVFTTLYTRYFDRLYGYFRVALRSQHEAEDATQQIFTQMLEGLNRYERRAQPFRAWLFVVARNHAVSVLRKTSRLELTEPEDLDRRRDEARESELPALSWISDRDLLIFIERLPFAQQQVLALRFMIGLSTEEIAEALGRTTVDIRGLQHRALRFLRRRLEAVGTESTTRDRIRMRSRHKQAPVLRFRRFALRAP